MKTKSLILIILFLLTTLSNKAQITPSLTIPFPIPEYNGTYQDFGQNHFFYPNDGEIRFADESQSDAVDVVRYYTKFAYPAEFLLNDNRMAFLSFRRDSVAGTPVDSLHRIDLIMERGNTSSAFLARVDTQNTSVLNYLTQYFSSSGRTDIRGGAAIAVQNIYPNIDMVYTSNNSGLKIYYVIYPGTSPSGIVLHFDGAKSTGISGNDLIVKSNWDEMKFIKPKMYQYTYGGGVVTPLTVCPASWQNLGGDMYGITTTSSWIASLPLIIEVSQGAVAAQTAIPGVQWSTYFGGSMQDLIYKAKSDAANNLFVAGSTTSPNFPVNAGPMVVSTVIGSAPISALTADGFVAKLNPAGVLQWVTYVGGTKFEEIFDFDFKNGDIYCIGTTNSTNMPVQTKTGAYNDATYNGTTDDDGFIFQLSANGQTNSWLTYFGGNKYDQLNACKFDGSGAFFVVGGSNSTNMSPMGAAGTYTQSYNASQQTGGNPVYDAIIMKFKAASDTLEWFTFYGTTTPVGMTWSYLDDEFFGLDINGSNIYACGYAGGTNLPGKINSKFLTNFYDGIITKFTSGGTFVTSKYTNGNAWNRSVKVFNGKVYTGGLAKFGMTTVPSGKYYYNGVCTTFDEQACFSVHNLNLDTTAHCTYLGNAGDDEAVDLQFASNGVFYISGKTQAASYPVVAIPGMYSASLNSGAQNYFVSAFRQNDTNMVWSTCLGSSTAEAFGNKNRHCASMALDGQGFLHLCGVTRSFNDFPVFDPGGGTYFQLTSASNLTNNATWNGTITRFGLAPLSTWVGIKDIQKNSFSFGLYPNPTSNYLIIDNPALFNKKLGYTVYDLQGKKLCEGNMNSTEQKKLDVSLLPQGIYLLNLSNGDKTYCNKFIKTGN